MIKYIWEVLKMTFTKKDLEKIKKETGNRLTKKVINILLNKGTVEDIETYINNLMYGGCQSGMEGSLIYYHDTLRFYKTFENEIQELLKEMFDQTGYTSPAELFGKNWDKEDIFAKDTANQNLLAWFGFEETVRKIAYDLSMDI